MCENCQWSVQMVGPQGRCKGHVIISDSCDCGYPELIHQACKCKAGTHNANWRIQSSPTIQYEPKYDSQLPFNIATSVGLTQVWQLCFVFWNIIHENMIMSNFTLTNRGILVWSRIYRASSEWESWRTGKSFYRASPRVFQFSYRFGQYGRTTISLRRNVSLDICSD